MGGRVLTEKTFDPEGGIPLVHVAFDQIPKHIIDRILLGDNTIIANITQEANEWEGWALPFPNLQFLIMSVVQCCGNHPNSSSCGKYSFLCIISPV